MNRSCISTISHHLNGMELSWEEFRDNICLRYGLMPQDIPATYDGCGNKLSIDHDLSCPRSVFVLEQHNYAAKEWISLGYQSLTPIEISYETQIKSRTVQGERTVLGALI